MSTNAAPALLARTIAALSLQRMERQEEQRQTLENELTALRSSWKKLPDRRAEIEKKAEAVTTALAQIPERPTLRQAQNQDPEHIADDLTLLICWVSDQVNVTAGISEPQMESAVELIIATYPSLRLEDVAISFRNGVAGRYKQVFNRIDPALLLSWVGEYEKELTDLRQEKAYARHANTKEDPTAPRSGEEGREIMQALRIQYHNLKQQK